jgi:8-oxo-dGTP pyrophosphatase MutT (NUDIX family)
MDYVRQLRQVLGSQRVFIPGVRALIVNGKGELLFQRRGDTEQWCLPGGAMELDETPLQALSREVEEETRLKVLEAEPLGLYCGPDQRFSYPNGDEVQCFALACIVRQWEGQPRPDGVEGTELRFFPPDQPPRKLIPTHHPTLQDFINYAGSFILR